MHALAAVALASLLAAAAPPPDASEAAERVYARDRYQTELPERPPEDRGLEGRPLPHLPIPPEEVVRPIAAILRAGFWVAVIVALALGAFWIARKLALLDREGERAEREEGDHAAADTIPGLPDAEALARDGFYAQAIHALLLRALAALACRAPQALAPALTSREVVDHTPLAGEPREALRELVAAVELTHFGGREAGRAEFERSLAGFRKVIIT